MREPADSLWKRYKHYLSVSAETKITVDVSRVSFTDSQLVKVMPAMEKALAAMKLLEAGSIANPGEQRQVGHFWLRAPELVPGAALRAEIEQTVSQVESFAARVHDGAIQGANGFFSDVLHIGIGGSALGPQLVCDALATNEDKLKIHFLENADPEPFDILCGRLSLGNTMVAAVSKCGFTPTPTYLRQTVEQAYREEGLNFAAHTVAVTISGSDVERLAQEEQWLQQFLMWDWVGGRMSVTSAVGLLPLALQGADIHGFLSGAAAMDRETRHAEPLKNPAMLLAMTWFLLGDGRGNRNMVVLPYKERLALLPRYVQQLVMESIGKRLDRAGNVVEQGLTVYGNKGSTDQHAYLQQLRAGRNDFFVMFVRVQQDRVKVPGEVMPDVSLGDYLFASAEGSRDALYERGRDSITITLQDLSAHSLGALIALMERAIGFYAELIDVNAYDQPGVDKFVAEPLAKLQQAILAQMRVAGIPQTTAQIAAGVGHADQEETIFKLLDRLATIPGRGVKRTYLQDGADENLFDGLFALEAS